MNKLQQGLKCVFENALHKNAENKTLIDELERQAMNVAAFPSTVKVLNIRMRDTEEVYVFCSDSQVRAELLRHVDENWADRMWGQSKPSDTDKRIEHYFAKDADESYEVFPAVPLDD